MLVFFFSFEILLYLLGVATSQRVPSSHGPGQARVYCARGVHPENVPFPVSVCQGGKLDKLTDRLRTVEVSAKSGGVRGATVLSAVR
jgi:hypothetical protein